MNYNPVRITGHNRILALLYLLTILRTAIYVKSKTSNWILIFFCYSITRTRACIRMMQFILNSIIGCSATLTGENFHIIICSLTTITGLRSIELGAA